MGGAGSREGGGSSRYGGDSPPGERRAPGALEAEILAIVRAAGRPLSPGDVRQALAARSLAGPPEKESPAGPEIPAQGLSPEARRAELSYSTVVTIMSRLHAKGLLSRQRAGRGFTYTPVDKASVAARLMSQVLGREQDHDAVLSRFVSGLSRRDARLLRELLGSDSDPGRGDPAASGQLE